MAQVLVSPSGDSPAAAAARALLSGAPTHGPQSPPTLDVTPTPTVPRRPMTDEEHAALVKIQRAAKAGVRPPRRSHSASEYDLEQLQMPPPPRYLYTPVLAPTLASPISPLTPLTPGLPAVMELASPSTPTTPSATLTTTMAFPSFPQQQQQQPPMHVRSARPKPKKPPRRAFSLMEYEPVVHTHRPSNRVSLLDLPTDIHFAIFDFLDPIDSVCFGLSSRVFYPIHRRLYGRVLLSSRRHGPNTLEWAWRGAGSLRHPGLTPPHSPKPRALPPLQVSPMDAGAASVSASAPTTPAAMRAPQSPGFPLPQMPAPGPSASSTGGPSAPLRPMVLQRTQTLVDGSGPNPARPPPKSLGLVDREAIRLDGQVYCRKCGTSRCELHSHLREWMGPDREYCSVARKFGRKAPVGARESCYKRSPKNPSACGRHTPRMRASAPVSPKLQPVRMA